MGTTTQKSASSVPRPSPTTASRPATTARATFAPSACAHFTRRRHARTAVPKRLPSSSRTKQRSATKTTRPQTSSAKTATWASRTRNPRSSRTPCSSCATTAPTPAVTSPAWAGRTCTATSVACIRKCCAIFARGIRKSSRTSTNSSHNKTSGGTRSTATILREPSTRAGSRDIRNAGSVGRGSMGMTSCTRIAETSTSGAMFVTRGMEATTRSTMSTTKH